MPAPHSQGTRCFGCAIDKPCRFDVDEAFQFGLWDFGGARVTRQRYGGGLALRLR